MSGVWGERDRPWTIAHRGSPIREVENTLPSFQRGLEYEGADGFELDLSLTRDGEIVIWHDWTPGSFDAVSRKWGLEPAVAYKPRWPDRTDLHRSLTTIDLDDVRRYFGYCRKRGDSSRIASAHILTLDEFLAWAVARPRLRVIFFDVKMPKDEIHFAPAFMRRFEELIAKHAPHFRFYLETPHREVLQALKAIEPARSYTLDVGPIFGYVPTPRVYSAVKRAIEMGNSCATLQRPPPSILRPFGTYCRIARHDQKLRTRHNAVAPPGARVEKLVGYTVSDEYEMKCCLGMGFDGLQTNYPDRLARVIAELEATGRPAEVAAATPLPAPL